jgi:hypothetical protein
MLLLPVASVGISKYVDEHGRLVFVDDESKIPARYLKKAKSLESIDEPTDEEKAAQAERLRQERETKQEELARERQKQAEEQWKKPFETEVTIYGDLILVPVQVAFGNSQSDLILRLAPDIPETVFQQRGLAALALDPEEGEPGHEFGTSDEKVPARQVAFKTVTVGPFKAYNVPALVIDPQTAWGDYDGLLGRDILGHLSYEVDYIHQVIHWQP